MAKDEKATKQAERDLENVVYAVRSDGHAEHDTDDSSKVKCLDDLPPEVQQFM